MQQTIFSQPAPRQKRRRIVVEQAPMSSPEVTVPDPSTQQAQTPMQPISNQTEPVLVKIQTPPLEKQVETELKKEDLLKEKTMEQKFDELVDRSKKVLYRLQSAMPFDPFPDVVEIDVSQVHITHYTFFKSKRLHSIAIKDISDVFVETSYLFGSLKIVDRNFVENEVVVGYLKRSQAIKAKKIIQGLMIGERENIDFSQIHDDELAIKLEELGSPTQTGDV